jgi:flagellin-like hook-associated protein FlgL
VNLTAAINANLLSLQNTQTLLNQTQLSLSTGKKVNSALDNPEAFFAAQSLTNRAGDLSNVLDGISQGVQTIQTANDGITAITSLLQQAQSVAQQALSESNANAGGPPTDVNSLTASFNQILTQITNLANDSSYQGTNLLNSATNSLTITYDETGRSTQTIQGVDFQAGSTATGAVGGGATVGLLIGNATTANAANSENWNAAGPTAAANIQASITSVTNALTTVRAQASTLGQNLGTVQTYQAFNKNLINDLNAGANDLTAADTNQESAALLTLQTQQQLGISALSLASLAQQAVLKLFP